MMKKIVTAFLALWIAVAASAQTQSLEFHYIAHDRTTPVVRLCEVLEQIYDDAVSSDSRAVIFYMANYDRPIIVKINLQGDNRDDFRTIIRELRLKPAHDTYADTDYAGIIDLFNTHDFITEHGTPEYSSVEFSWYVNPSFWKYRYNEELIASLCFELELNMYPDYVKTRVLHAAGDGLVIDREFPFGTMNFSRGSSVKFMQY